MKLDDRAAAIGLDYVDVDRQSDRHQIEFWLVTLVRICRKVTDTRLAPHHLRIRHRRDETPAEMRSFFGCDVEFGAASDEIIFPAPVASLPIVGSDNYLNDLLLRYAEEALADRPQERASLRSAVERSLRRSCSHMPKPAHRTSPKSSPLARERCHASFAMRMWRSRKYWKRQEQLLQSVILSSAICRSPRSRGCWDMARSALSPTRSNVGLA